MRDTTQTNLDRISKMISEGIQDKEIKDVLEISTKTLRRYKNILGYAYIPPVTTLNQCLNCGTDTPNLKYCSKSCSASVSNKLYPKRLRKAKCTKCENITKSWRHTLCEEHWQEYMSNKPEVIKELPLSTYWDKKSLENLHISSKNAHIRLIARSWFKELTKQPCANCGYSKHVELCHIRPLSSFVETDKIGVVNGPDNIIQLCPNCHWEFDNKLITLYPQRDSNPH